MTEHFAAEAPGLASLPAGDPDLAAAETHAAICPPCAKALAEARALLELLAGGEAEAAPPSLRRVHESTVTKIDRPRRLWAAPLALLAWAAIVALARHRVPSTEAWALSIAGAAVAAIGAAAAAWLGGRALPILVVASGLLAFLVGAHGGLSPELGLHCVLTEIGGAIIALGPTMTVARRATPGFLAAVAAAGATAGHAALNLGCPARVETAHLWAFHTGGVVLAALLGLVAARLFQPGTPNG